MQFDLGYRPETYWPWLPSEATMLARIKGSVRRAAASAALEAGGSAVLDPSLFAESLSDEERRAAAGVHPALMGGEYLPDARGDEVEIARIELASTMRDVISIRACRRGSRIGYGVVDEYSTTFAFRPATSAKPLSLRQLIGLIESIAAMVQTEAAYPEGPGLVTAFRDENAEWDIESAATFVTVSSELYCDLEAYYEQDAQSWLFAQTTDEWL